MWWKLIELSLLSVTGGVTNLNGTSSVYLTDRVVDKVRYVVNTTVVTNSVVKIQVSLDDSVWADAVALTNSGTATFTGVIDGPIKHIRATTTGVSGAAAVSVKTIANVSP